jgi:3,4-dihydroxy-2-butanone 4-phosphate synthase
MNIIIEQNEIQIQESLTRDQNFSSAFSSIEDILDAIKRGEMIILFDDEDRENEGDFIVCADLVNQNQLCQMIEYGSGLIYLVIDQTLQEKLGLKLLRKSGHAAHNPFHVAFSEPIEASAGISTGVSVKDRLTTIRAACAKNVSVEDIITPGHILTIVAHPMGLFARNGHTEASQALVKLAGFQNGCAVGCEVVTKNGEMARMPDLIKISKNLGIKICKIQDLVRYLKK